MAIGLMSTTPHVMLGVVAGHDHLGALGQLTTPVTSVVRK
jgi:hypothetical protein